MSILTSCKTVNQMCAWCPQSSEEDTRYPRTRWLEGTMWLLAGLDLLIILPLLPRDCGYRQAPVYLGTGEQPLSHHLMFSFYGLQRFDFNRTGCQSLVYSTWSL